MAEEERVELLDQGDGGKAEVSEGGPAQGAQLCHDDGARRLLRGGGLVPHGAGEVEAPQARETADATDGAEFVEAAHAKSERVQERGGRQGRQEGDGGSVEVSAVAGEGRPVEGE